MNEIEQLVREAYHDLCFSLSGSREPEKARIKLKQTIEIFNEQKEGAK